MVMVWAMTEPIQKTTAAREIASFIFVRFEYLSVAGGVGKLVWYELTPLFLSGFRSLV